MFWLMKTWPGLHGVILSSSSFNHQTTLSVIISTMTPLRSLTGGELSLQSLPILAR